MVLTFLLIAETLYIYLRHDLDGFSAFMQEAPLTNVPVTLACAAILWLLAGLFLWLIQTGRLNRTNLVAWAGFFIVTVSYLNILRERVRYGDVEYYIEAAAALFNHQPLPDTYLYPPLWATLLSFLVPLGVDGVFLICWLLNVLSLMLFYFLLLKVLELYGVNPQVAALITALFLLVNMPVMRTLLYVQVNLHAINLIFLSLLLYQKRPLLSALSLALAIHLKASPALLVLAFLLELNWKWAGWFAFSMLLIAGITVAAYGLTPFLDFVNNFILLNSPRALSLRDNSFDSAIGMTLSYLRADPAFIRVLVYIAKGIVLLAGILLSIRTTGFSSAENGAKLFNGIVPLMVAMTLFSPLVWEHHGVFLSLPVLLMLKKMDTPTEWVAFGAIYLFEFLMPSFDYFPWSYVRLAGMLILFVYLWQVRNRKDSSFFDSFNAWTLVALKA